MKFLLAVFSMGLLASCTHGRASVQNSVTSGNTVPVAATSAAAANSAAPQGKGKPVINMELLKEGYHTELHRGQILYCRTEVIAGSRFENQVCLTDNQVIEQQQRARELLSLPRPIH